MGTRGHRAAGVITGLLVACFTFVGAAAPTAPASVDFLPLARADGTALLREVTPRVMSFGCVATNNGTAVQLDDGRLVTAAHVVDGTRLINVVPDLGPTSVASAAVAPGHDVAVLRQPPNSVEGVVLATDDPHPGTEVLVAGYPNGQLSLLDDDAVVDGYVDGRTVGQPEGRILRLRHAATTGMSGGPVLDPAGRLAGILIATRKGATETFAIPASTLRRVLEGDGLQPAGHC